MNDDDFEMFENLQKRPIETVNYAFKMCEDIFSRLDNHIQILKRLDNTSTSKQRWMTEAIKEKLENEKKLTSDQLPKDKHVSVRVEKNLAIQIEKNVEKYRVFRRSFSKKQWLIDAICEKLLSEESKAKVLLKKLAQSFDKK